LKIPEPVVKELLDLNDFEKPALEVSNYYLMWNDRSPGIKCDEIPELKGFIKDAIPFLGTGYNLLGILERSQVKDKDKTAFQRKLSPYIRLSHRNRGRAVAYELYMKSDGSTFINRVKGIGITTSDDATRENVTRVNIDIKSVLYLRWILGELLFARNGVVRRS
jgi:hypothetical protein